MVSPKACCLRSEAFILGMGRGAWVSGQSIQDFQGVRSQKGGNHMEMRAKYCSKFPLTYLLFSAYARGNYN